MSIVEVVLGSLDEYPLLLTVEEAAGVLRIGWSLAYELARTYESSDGQSGLPVLHVGALLRVPRWALAEMISTGHVVRLADLVEADAPTTVVALSAVEAGEVRRLLVAVEAPGPASPPSSSRSRRAECRVRSRSPRSVAS
jgi:hypothetical protein